MDNLFGNVDLVGLDVIEIPDKVETPVETTTEEVITPKTPNPDKQDEDDGLIEIPEKVTKPSDEDKDNDLDPEGFKEETDDETPPETKGSSSSSPYKPFAKALAEEGFLPSITDEEFDALAEEMGGGFEAVMELTRRSVSEEIENYKKESEEDYRAFLEARDSGLDLNQWADTYEAKKTYSSITDEQIDEDEVLQKNLIRADLKGRGFTEEEINDDIDSFETSGKLATKAKTAHKNLIKATEQQELQLKKSKEEQEKQLKIQREENIKNLKKEIYAANEIIPGIKINKQTQDKIFNNITTAVKTAENGQPMNAAMAKRAENPIRYAMIENYLIELGVFDGKWDKIVSRTKSKAAKELEEALSSSKNTDFKGGKNTLGKGGSDEDVEFYFPKQFKK